MRNGMGTQKRVMVVEKSVAFSLSGSLGCGRVMEIAGRLGWEDHSVPDQGRSC